MPTSYSTWVILSIPGLNAVPIRVQARWGNLPQYNTQKKFDNAVRRKDVRVLFVYQPSIYYLTKKDGRSLSPSGGSDRLWLSRAV